MALRKTKVERIIDSVLAAAGLPEAETAQLLEDHWAECARRSQLHGSPHRPEWRSSTNSHRDRYSTVDTGDPKVRETFGKLVEVCYSPPSRNDLD